MALVDFLYRCPFCGHDPLEGKGLTAACPGCDRSFEPGGSGTGIRVTEPEGRVRDVPAGLLGRRLDELGGALATARDGEGRIFYSSRARARFAHREEPVRFRRELLGYSELFGDVEEGLLTLEHDRLHFEPDAEGGAPGFHTWLLLELGALQTSSSSVQISPRDGGVVQFRFPDASVKRWEELLRGSIAEVWREAGKGSVVEFQPRIRAV